jgi:hypothetical protein
MYASCLLKSCHVSLEISEDVMCDGTGLEMSTSVHSSRAPMIYCPSGEGVQPRKVTRTRFETSTIEPKVAVQFSFSSAALTHHFPLSQLLDLLSRRNWKLERRLHLQRGAAEP